MKLRRQIAGLAVQLSSAAFLATQAFLAPRLLGAEHFGLAHVALAMPLFLQATMETVLFALNIQWMSATPSAVDERPRIARMWKDALAFSVVGALFIGGYLWRLFALHGTQDTGPLVIWAVLFLPVLTVNTIAMGVAYSVRAYAAVIAAYIAAAFFMGIGLIALRQRGSVGFVQLLVFNQIVMLAIFASVGSVRNYAREVWAQTIAPAHFSRWGRVYVPVLMGRFTLLLFTSGTMLLASTLISPQEVASLKVSLTIVTAGSYLLPISIPVLQSSWSSPSGSATEHRESAFRFMRNIFIIGCLVTVGLVLFGAQVRGLILRGSPQHQRFNAVFWSFPAYVMIGPFTAYLVAIRRTWILGWAFGASLVTVLGTTAIGHIEWSVTGGAVAFVCAVVTLYLLVPSRIDSGAPEAGPPLKPESGGPEKRDGEAHE